PVVYRRIGGAPAAIHRAARRRWHRFFMARADAVVAVADAVRAETLALFRLEPARVVTIPNAVEPSRVQGADRAVARAELGLPADSPVVLSLGALSWEKDPLGAVEASAPARAADGTVVHLFVGDGPLRDPLEERVRRCGAEASVRVLPGRADVAAVLAAADVLLFTSRSDGMEGMPAVIIEAGLAGRATVAVDVAGVGEVIEHDETGVLVAHPADVGDALVALLDDPARVRALGAAARDRCEAAFTIEAVAPRYADVLARLVRR
nr:glycosyltransferase family 4 protein [Acidimicrobiia bacterium]